MIIGPYVAAVGLLVYYSSVMLEREYDQMRKQKRLDDSNLRTKFNAADSGGYWKKDGKLDTAEFAVLYQDLLHLTGAPNYNELQIALLEVDTEHNGRIEFDELKAWYHKKMDE